MPLPGEATNAQSVVARAEDVSPAGAGHGRLLWIIIIIVAGCASASWIVAAALMSGRGFEITDEGSYLLSYRWWQTDTRNYTGAQYIYGPLFQWLGYNVRDLRLASLATVVLSHAIFGWTFMFWLRTQRPEAPPTRLWEFAGASVILASGGVVYGWLPATPGYDDIAVLGSLLLAATALRVGTKVARGTRCSPVTPVAAGAVVAVMLLAKWTSGLTVAVLTMVVSTLILLPLGARSAARYVGWVFVGVAAMALLIDLAVMPLSQIVPPIVAVTRLETAGTHSPLYLVLMYTRSTMKLTGLALLISCPVLAVLIAYRVKQSVSLLRFAMPAALILSFFIVFVAKGWEGGEVNLWGWSASLAALALIAGVASWTARVGVVGPMIDRASQKSSLVLILLLLLPASQAVGTDNYLFMVAVNGFAAWVALLLLAITAMDRRSPTRFVAFGVTGTTVVLTATIGTSGLLQHPYRTGGYATSIQSAPASSPALASLRIPPHEAARLTYLEARLRPYLTPPGRPILAYDEMAGIVFALGGRPVGEVWLGYGFHERSAAGVRAACANGNPWGDTQPILLFNGPITRAEVNALRPCGLSFDRDYREMPMQLVLAKVRVFVPTRGIGLPRISNGWSPNQPQHR